MPKIIYRDTKDDITTSAEYRFHKTKYFSLFLNAYKFKNLDEEQTYYLLKKFWKYGTIAAYILPDTKGEPTLSELYSNSSTKTIKHNTEYGLIMFSQYATSHYNVTNFPSVVTFINERGATFIPKEPQRVNFDCVIGFAHSSHESVEYLVDYYVRKIVDVERTINANLFAHKLPRLIVCSPEDKARVEELVRAIEKGDTKIFISAEDYKAISNVLSSGEGGFIIDKLYNYKNCLENELLTLLGINNIPVQKKERLITDEAESNDELINDNSDTFLDSLKQFCEKVKEVLGYPLEVEAKSSPKSNEKETTDDEDKDMEE